MQFLSSAIRSEAAERPAGSAEDAEVWPLPLTRDTERSWRRVTLRVLLASTAARHQVVLLEISDIEPRGLTPDEDLPAPQVLVEVSRSAIFARAPLTISRSSRCLTPAEDCRHRTLLGRGNNFSRWWTCRECGMR